MTDLPFLEQLAEEEALFKRFSLVGHNNVRAAGNLKTGFAVNIDVVGGGDSGGTGTPTGACCYNDGTCDDLTCADCEDAGGTCQGLGTTCAGTSCTGACCEPGCVEDTTPDGCTADGGTFQGFGTTCDPDPCPPPPPTGACCADDGTCSITAEEDCTGTYQGDGTDCDPNPCSLPDCSCGFAAYDGSGRRFLTETLTGTGTLELSCIDPPLGFQCNAGIDCAILQESSYDPDTCELTVSCDFGLATCCTSDVFNQCNGSTINDCGSCETYITGCTPTTVTSATTKDCHQSGTVSNGDPCDPPSPAYDKQLHYVLSNECTPI